MDYRQHAFELFDFQILHLQVNTPLFILGLLLIVMASLHFLLFKPVLRTLDGRKQELERLNSETRQQQGEVARLTEQYKRDLDVARGQIELARQAAHAAGQKAQESVLDKARQDAEKELQAALTDLQKEMRDAGTQITRAARTLAQQAADRVLSA